MIKIYDYAQSTTAPVAVLTKAFNIGYNKRLNELWTAEFSMAATDPKVAECLAFRYIEIFDGLERVELFRILPTRYTKGNEKIITYQCEHVISTLIDDIMFGYHDRTGYTITQNLTYILGYQTTTRWAKNTISFGDVMDFKWENENLLSALFAIPKALVGNYQWTYDTTSYPWKFNLIAPSVTPIATIEYGHNMVDITRETDPTYIVTRLYPLGYGEGVNQLTIESVNGGLPYINSSTIGTYGVIATTYVSRETESAQQLYDLAAAYLETIKVPRVVYSINGADIYSITGVAIDNFRAVGSVVTIDDPDLGTFNARIMNVSKGDLVGNPGDIRIDISNKLLDLFDQTADIENRQRISDTYAQGSTNIDSNDYQDNCDHTHPATIKFFIPNECVHINKCLLTFETDEFRAYDQAITDAGATNQTSSSGGSYVTTTTSSGGSSVTSSSSGGTTVTSSSGGGATVTSANGGNSTITSASGGGETITSSSSSSTITSTNSGNINWWDCDFGIFSQAPTIDLSTESNYTTNPVSLTYHSHYVPIELGTWLLDHTHNIDASHTHQITIPSHSHIVYTSSHSHSVTTPSHSHTVTIANHTHTNVDPAHTHNFTDPTHSHSVTIPTHTHTVTIPAHGHDIDYGIYEFGYLPPSHVIKVDNTTIPITALSGSNIDIVPYLANSGGIITRGTFHEVTIYPNTNTQNPLGLARISACIVKQTFIQSRGEYIS